jgi:hypothetical protein
LRDRIAARGHDYAIAAAGRHQHGRKAPEMAHARCTCGFTEAEGMHETIGDHLLEVFAPEDDKGADGQAHFEGDPALTCRCGFRASTIAELDSHFLEMFVPAGRVGPGGVEHTVITLPRRAVNPACPSG